MGKVWTMQTTHLSDSDAFHESLRFTQAALSSFLEREKPGLEQAVECLFGCRGKVVVCGMGKCGFVGQKLAATFNSTGTPAAFLHPAEAIHGDLGMVHPSDVVLMLSNSGETSEIVVLLPILKQMRVHLIALTGRPESTLGKQSDAVIDTSVAREADPLDTAPTASTTVMLAAGDALSAVLMHKREFGTEDYARFHPGGSLGRRLLCTVESLMHTGKQMPVIHQDAEVRKAIYEISSKRMGATMVIDDDGVMVGMLTDGDLRRLFERDEHPLLLPAGAVMSRRPRTITAEKMAVDALQLMEENLITSLPVLDSSGKPRGIVHLHDLLRAGIA